MTTPNTNNETTALGNGSTTVFSFNFYVQNASQVEAYTRTGGALPVKVTSGITVTLNTTSVGGTVTFSVAPPSGTTLIFRRTSDFLQSTAFPLNADLDERALEAALDKLDMQDIDLLQRINRAPQLPYGSSSNFVPTISGTAVTGSTLRAQLDSNGNVIGFVFSTKDVDNLDASPPVGTIDPNSPVTPTGATRATTIANALSMSGRVLHSDWFSDIDSTGANDTLSAMQKFFNKGGDATKHTVLIVDPGTYKLGNAVPAMSAILGSLTVSAIEYKSANVLRVTFTAGTLTSSTVISGIATGSSFLTIEGAANDGNNGRFTILSMVNADVSATGDGVTNTFAFNFLVETASDMVVTVDGVTKTQGTHYNIDSGGIGNPAGGTITFTAGNTPGNTLAISIKGRKHVTISASRSDASLNETGLSLTSTSNRIRIAGMEPLYYRDNTSHFIRGKFQHYINSGKQHILCGYNIDSYTSGVRTYDVHFDWTNGGMVEFPSLGTPSPSKKGAAITNTERWSVRGYKSSGNDRGSFDLQFRNSSHGQITGTRQYSGDSVGEDGVHGIQNCTDVNISDLDVQSGDDSLSLTQENEAFAFQMERIQISNCTLRTANNSSFKCLIDSTSAAAGAYIRKVTLTNCHLGVHDNTTTGTLLRITSISGYEDLVSDINVDNCTTDNINGALTSTSYRLDYCARVTISGGSIFGAVRNSLIINGGKDHLISGVKMGRGSPQTATFNIVGLTATDITYISGNTFEATFSGSPDLSTMQTTFASITFTSGTVNFVGTYQVSAFDNTAKTIRFTVSPKFASSSFNEATITAAAYTRKQPGEIISIAGGDGHVISDCSFFGSYNDTNGRVIAHIDGILLKTDTATSQVPTNISIVGNRFYDFIVNDCVNIQQATYSNFERNKNFRCTSRYFIQEGTSSSSDNNTFVDNEDLSASKAKISYQPGRSSGKWRGNRGSNSDAITGTVTLPSGSTTVTLVLANSFTDPTSSGTVTPTTSGVGWTQAFNNGAPTNDMLMLSLQTSIGSAKNFWWSYNSGTRTYTITVDTNPGADVTFGYRLDAGRRWAN